MVKLPPPIWALIYASIAAAASWAAGWPGVADLRNLPFGIVLFRRAGTEVKPDSPTNKALVAIGPYRITRNPMYLGLTIMTFGVVFMVGSWPMLAVPVLLFATVNLVHIPFEEAKMRRQFGDAFDAYTQQVRRWV